MIGVFPTPVGMNREWFSFAEMAESVPHTRGDEPHSSLAQHSRHRVFPTPVGMNRGQTVTSQAIMRVPHTRGDEPRTV